MSQLCIENKSFYTVTDVKNLTTLGRDKAYALMKSKGFPAIKLGRTYLVISPFLAAMSIKPNGKSIFIPVKLDLYSGFPASFAYSLKPGRKALHILGIIQCPRYQRIPSNRLSYFVDELLRSYIIWKFTRVVNLNETLIDSHLDALTGFYDPVSKGVDHSLPNSVNRYFWKFFPFKIQL